MNARILAIAPLVFIGLTAGPVLAQDDALPVQSGDDVSKMLVQQQAPRWVPGQIIIKFKTTAPRDDDARLNAMGFSDHLATTSGGEYIYSLPRNQITTLSATQLADQTEAAVAEMRGEPDVEYAQLNYVMHVLRTPNDPGFALQWHYRDNGTAASESPGGINLPRAWDRTTGSSASVIAVIDTGILPDHPDIFGSPNLLPGFDMISDVFTANDGDARDSDPTDPGDGTAAGECGPGSRPAPDSWHGTHVAGTVGVGRTNNGEGVAGVNWSSRVVPVRALGRCGGSIVDINDAMRWAAGLPVPGVAINPNPAKVINMSLGASAPCSQSPATQSAINDVVAAGTAVVVAAGNEAVDASTTFPAGCNNVIAVAASDFNGRLVTRYSNFGAAVDIMAPGGDVNVDADNDGNPDGVLSMVEGGYAYFNGTSMAAPHAAGVAGLLIAQDPTLTPQEIEALLKQNALPRNSGQCPRACGAGLLNADIEVDDSDDPVPLSLQVSPTNFELDEGASESVTATVTRGGSVVANASVRFTSEDPDIATVSPSNIRTDANGRAVATLTAVVEGNTSLSVSVPGQTQTSPVRVEIRVVPGIGLIALLLLVMIVAVAGHRRLSERAGR